MKKEGLAMKDTDLVVKSNTLVSSRYKLEWSEHRLVLFLISKIDKDALTEIESNVSNLMMEEKQKYGSVENK